MDDSFADANTTRDTGRGTRRSTGTDASTIPTEHQRVQVVSRMRRPYLTEEDFLRGTTITTSTNDSMPAPAYFPNPNADSATALMSHPFSEPSESESRRRVLWQVRAAEPGATATTVTEEDMRRLTTTTSAGGAAARRREISPGSHEPSRQLQRASVRANRPADPTVEDRVRMRAALVENHRQRYRIMAVQMGLDGPTVSDVAVLRGLDMREEAEHGPAGFRGLAGAYVQVIARGTWTFGERERIRGEARGVVEREWAMAGPVDADTDREAMAVAHRRGLEDWAGGEDGRDDGRDDDDDDDDNDDDNRGGDEEMLENDIENENENDHDIDADEDGWRDLESALSSHYRRRNARNLNLEAERAEADIMIQRAEADMSGLRRSTERAARRREERITSLIDGTANTGQNFRLRHRVSRERILRAMEGFMAERDRRDTAAGGGGPGGGLSEVERQEVERRQGQVVQLHRSRRIAEMMRERESRRLAGAGAGGNFSATANTKTRNMLEYLSRLRSCDPLNPVEAFELAMSLDVDIRPKGHPDRPYTLLVSTATIPPPAYSSFLTPGATFMGSQHAPHDVSGAHLLSRDRDYLRRMVATRNRTRNRSQAHLPIPVPASIATLVEAERFLGGHGSGDRSSSSTSRDLGLEYEEGEDRSGYPTIRVTDTSPPPLRRPQTRIRAHTRAPDRWPVSVTLHSVDLERMTVMGTMSASHIPDKAASGSTEHKTDADEDGDRNGEGGSSMRSFFEGEIVDFRSVTLETERYKWEKGKGEEMGEIGVGVNMEVDARYWGQIGPFREVFEKEGGSESWNMMVEGEDGGGDQKGGQDRDTRLARCLGSKDWIDKVMREWVLMRWKERIFLPPATPSSSSASNHNTDTTNHPHLTPPNLNRLGLSISGFYYVAMKRDTGRLEGLYYDPQSQPYQRLELAPDGGGVRKWFPSSEFGAL